MFVHICVWLCLCIFIRVFVHVSLHVCLCRSMQLFPCCMCICVSVYKLEESVPPAYSQTPVCHVTRWLTQALDIACGHIHLRCKISTNMFFFFLHTLSQARLFYVDSLIFFRSCCKQWIFLITSDLIMKWTLDTACTYERTLLTVQRHTQGAQTSGWVGWWSA